LVIFTSTSSNRCGNRTSRWGGQQQQHHIKPCCLITPHQGSDVRQQQHNCGIAEQAGLACGWSAPPAASTAAADSSSNCCRPVLQPPPSSPHQLMLLQHSAATPTPPAGHQELLEAPPGLRPLCSMAHLVTDTGQPGRLPHGWLLALIPAEPLWGFGCLNRSCTAAVRHGASGSSVFRSVACLVATLKIASNKEVGCHALLASCSCLESFELCCLRVLRSSCM
jgi:hypothetical protein